MKFRGIELFLGMFLAVSIFAMGILFESSRNDSPITKPTEQSSSNQAHVEPSTFWNWVTHDAAGFFTACLVIVGFGQAGLFVWQLTLMRDGINDARIAAEAARVSAETAKEQVAVTKIGIFDLERAYLAVGPTQIILDFIPGRNKDPSFYAPGDPLEITAHLFIQNTGRTGATIKKIYGEFSNILPPGDTPTYGNVDPVETDLSIPANASDVLTPFDFKSSYLGDQFFWGYVEYTDIFRITHTSRFCAHFGPATQGKAAQYHIAGAADWRECD